MGTWSCEDWAQVCVLSKPHPFPLSAPPWSEITFCSLQRCCHSELRSCGEVKLRGWAQPFQPSLEGAWGAASTRLLKVGGSVSPLCAFPTSEQSRRVAGRQIAS